MEKGLKDFPISAYPYSIRMILRLGSDIEIDLETESISLQFAGNYSAKLTKLHTTPKEKELRIKRYMLNLDAFKTASEAEKVGVSFAWSILWVAVSKRVSIAVEKWSGASPFTVHDRSLTSGLEARSEGYVYYPITPQAFLQVAENGFSRKKELPPGMLTSIQFYAAARMESTYLARFVALMTALECIAEQRIYDDEITGLVNSITETISKDPIFLNPSKLQIRDSLINRLRELKRESIRQAILRVVRDSLGDIEIVRWVDETYNLRSKLLHEGNAISDLSERVTKLEEILRQIYSSMLNISLSQPSSLQR